MPIIAAAAIHAGAIAASPATACPACRRQSSSTLSDTDVGDNLFRERRESFENARNDKKPLDGREQEVNFSVECKASDMGDLTPGERLLTPKPPDDQSVLRYRNPPAVRHEENGKGGNEKQSEDKFFRRLSLQKHGIRQETEKKNHIQTQRDEQRLSNPVETPRHISPFRRRRSPFHPSTPARQGMLAGMPCHPGYRSPFAQGGLFLTYPDNSPGSGISIGCAFASPSTFRACPFSSRWDSRFMTMPLWDEVAGKVLRELSTALFLSQDGCSQKQ